MKSAESDQAGGVDLIGFALADCEIEIDRAAAKYLKAVHRTALELASPNCFGVEIGGFWLMREQLAQLRKLPAFYPLPEAPHVERAVEAYIKAQLPVFESNQQTAISTQLKTKLTTDC